MNMKHETKYLESITCLDEEENSRTMAITNLKWCCECHSIFRHNTTKQQAGTNAAPYLPRAGA
jgi:nitrate/TMAO reductase-like tetraheme cytochrome c subunit